MVTGNLQGDGEKNPKGPTRSWGAAASGQSVSSSGSLGSPSSQSEAGMATPAHENSLLRLSHLEIHGENGGSQDVTPSKKKKRGQRAGGADKSGRGLREFSRKVCDKVESKGRTTYSEVADELVAEYADVSHALGSDDQQGESDKNIRRRVYDALNVLMAMDIISKDKKEIQWKGLPRTSLNDIEELRKERIGLTNRVEKKAAYLQELEEQLKGYQNLIRRNEQVYGNGNAPSGGVTLPFILVQTRPHAVVEVEISEDTQLVHMDFGSTPFELHDDNSVLKQMKISGKPQSAGAGSSMPSTHYLQNPPPSSLSKRQEPQSPAAAFPSNAYRPQLPLSSTRSNASPASPPLPGILKPRV